MARGRGGNQEPERDAQTNSARERNLNNISQDLDKKNFAEDNLSSNGSPSLGLSNALNQKQNKKASSFVGGGFTDALPGAEDFRRKESSQSFQNLWSRNTQQKSSRSNQRSSNNTGAEESKDPPINLTGDSGSKGQNSERSLPQVIEEEESPTIISTSFNFQPETSPKVATVGGN